MMKGLPVEPVDWNVEPKGSMPDPNEVDIWEIQSDSERFEDTGFFACLSEEEQARASRFRFERDRRSYRVSHACKRYVLSHYLDLDPAELVFSAGEWGKPRLSGSAAESGWEFNLSHSKGVTLIGVSRGTEIGVDVEAWQTTERMEPIFERFASRLEKACFAEVKNVDRSHLLTAWWVSKEGFIKAVGRGLSQSLSDFSIRARSGSSWSIGDVPVEYGLGDDYRLRLLALGSEHLGAVVGHAPSLSIRGFQFESAWFGSRAD